jgi:hypothetical protein
MVMVLRIIVMPCFDLVVFASMHKCTIHSVARLEIRSKLELL